MFNTNRPFFKIANLEFTNSYGLCKVVYETTNNKVQDTIISLFTRGIAYSASVVTTLMAYRTAASLTKDFSEGLIDAYNIDSRRLLVYPLAQIIVYTPSIIGTLASLWVGMNYYTLLIITALYNLDGTLNFLIYGGLLNNQPKLSPIQQARYDNSSDNISKQFSASNNNSLEVSRGDRTEAIKNQTRKIIKRESLE